MREQQLDGRCEFHEAADRRQRLKSEIEFGSRGERPAIEDLAQHRVQIFGPARRHCPADDRPAFDRRHARPL
jgi:hypothetical protein